MMYVGIVASRSSGSSPVDAAIGIAAVKRSAWWDTMNQVPRPPRLKPVTSTRFLSMVYSAKTFCNSAMTDWKRVRSEEHTSELQSLRHLVCRLLLEKKNK